MRLVCYILYFLYMKILLRYVSILREGKIVKKKERKYNLNNLCKHRKCGLQRRKGANTYRRYLHVESTAYTNISTIFVAIIGVKRGADDVTFTISGDLTKITNESEFRAI